MSADPNEPADLTGTIYAEQYASNANSCKVLEKAGFVREGRLRSSVIKDGQVLDQLLYARISGSRRLSISSIP
jgi:RimJ/RimL family protein N-acetyltransferase